MPLVTNSFVETDIRPLGPDPTTDPETDDVSFFRDVVPAAFRLENTLASRINELDRPGFDADTAVRFDPFEGNEGTVFEQFPEALVTARSPEDKAVLRLQLERELEDRRLIASAGLPGVAALMAGGFFDPMILLPVGQAASAARQAVSSPR